MRTVVCVVKTYKLFEEMFEDEGMSYCCMYGCNKLKFCCLCVMKKVLFDLFIVGYQLLQFCRIVFDDKNFPS